MMKGKNMKRSLKLALAALFAGVAVSASAANPFTDVEPTHWSYQAVAELADEGVLEGYPDGTFKGEKNITRYEMAQFVARLMAREDQLTADQKETAAKLSAEYAEELKSLGLRIEALEAKAKKFQTILELQVSYQPVYDNIFTGEKKDVYGARLRFNNIAAINDRTTLYNTMEVFTGMGSNAYHDLNDYDIEQEKLHMRTLFATYHFGGGDGNNQGTGPSKDIIAIGEFPVRMGVTGYTYDGRVKGAMVQFGDYRKGGRFTLAYGRASDINYAYTSPMMKGVANFKAMAAGVIQNRFPDLVKGTKIEGYAGVLAPVVSNSIARTTDYSQLQSNISNDLKSQFAGTPIAGMADAISAQLMGRASTILGMFSDKMNWETGTYYPLRDRGVEMADGADKDVPVAYVSYVYKQPQKYEFHAYGMKACGPVDQIARAYGFAAAVNVTDKWRVQGEYVKNLRRLPLNDERPYSFNYGISYGTANVLDEKSFSIGVDYVYSQAGTYFGGSSNDIAGQYMGHVYSNWHGRRMPAYIADKLDAVMAGTDNGQKFGGAKFFLAKAQYVPKKGLILEADYGFKAKDMGGRKMDNMFRLQATMYYK